MENEVIEVQDDKVLVKENESKGEQEAVEIRKKLDESDFSTIAGQKISIGAVEGVPILGYEVGFTIGERYIPHENADKTMNALHMKSDIRPLKSRPKDAFKNACVFEERETDYTDEMLKKKHGKSARFRAVWKAEQCSPQEYIISRKVYLVDERTGKKPKSDILFQKLARLVFIDEIEKDGKKVTVNRIYAETIDGDEKITKELKRSIEESYKMLMTHYTSKQVRDALRKWIVDNKGVQFTIGKGGVWFVYKKIEAELLQWKGFLKSCDKYKNGGKNYPVHLRIVPCVDTDDMKSYIAEDVASEVKSRVHNILEDAYAKLKDAKNDEQIEAVLSVKLQEKKEDVDGLLETYREILQSKIAVHLEVDAVRKEKIEEHLSDKAKAMLEEIGSV